MSAKDIERLAYAASAEHLDNWPDRVRAVLAAMREPDETLLTAMTETGYDSEHDEEQGRWWYEGPAPWAWRAAIDHLLAD